MGVQESQTRDELKGIFFGNITKSALTILTVVVPVIITFFGLADYLIKSLFDGIKISSENGGYAISGVENQKFDLNQIWHFVIPGTVIIVPSLIFFSTKLYSHLKTPTVSKAFSDQRKLVRLYSDIDNIANKMVFEPTDVDNDGISHTRYNYKKIHCRYEVGKDGTTSAEMTFEILADIDDVYFVKHRINADTSGCGVSGIENIGLTIDTPDEHCNTGFLPVKNTLHGKMVCIFMLPILKKGAQRTIKVKFKWPEFFGDLVRFGESSFVWDYKTNPRSVAGSFSYEFLFSKELGRITCDSILPMGDGEDLVQGGDENWQSWRYFNDDANSVSRPINLRFRKDESL